MQASQMQLKEELALLVQFDWVTTRYTLILLPILKARQPIVPYISVTPATTPNSASIGIKGAP